ncbi:hypothetical protein B0A49_00486 [Cryomyces minteri]|uniref:Chitobiosyldiphosphodolichol beta-mannosyltransferase n=1 Tax=Cryomyces minteri TaxID=331657 RepID=A0A4U0XXL7_9PEZI|nr:hypothetical protein B0A49_00486 [Cryomyces minteri]
MKVVDMFGTGLPVLGWSKFEAWPELVKEGVNGRGFGSAEELKDLLIELFGGDRDRLAKLRNGAMEECERSDYSEDDMPADLRKGHIMHFIKSLLLALAAAGAALALPAPRDASPAQVQTLVDATIAAMGASPSQVNQDELRAEIAPSALMLTSATSYHVEGLVVAKTQPGVEPGTTAFDDLLEIADQRAAPSKRDVESVEDAWEAQREHEAKAAKHVEARAPRDHHGDDDEAAPGILGFMTKGQAKHLMEQQKKKVGA